MTVREVLSRHIQEKFDNQPWVYDCLQGKTASFPHRPDPYGKPDISTPFSPDDPSDASLAHPDNPKPRYVVNIPMGRLPTKSQSHSKYNALFDRIRDESFGATAEESAEEIKDRVAVVLGINQIESIDPALNRSFRRFVKNLPIIDDVVSRTIGFFWKPKWFAKNPKAYPLKKAFLVLKALNAKKAEAVRREHEQPKGLADWIKEQIPYQKIRETIKTARSTRKFVKVIEEQAPAAPVYFTMMDDDCITLRGSVDHRGIFTRMDELIDEHNQPSIASLGYSLDPNEAPILRLAIKIDMAVRATMPLPYFPEPFTAVKVRNPNEPNFLRTLSFLGAGRSLESRRLIDSGLRKLTDGAVFRGDGGVVTTTPARMKTNYNTSVETLTTTILKKKQTLQALRGRTIQTHAFPKQWADILYAGLQFQTRVTDATGPMMHIFSVYDPISRMLDGTRKYTPAVFDQVMSHYNDPLTDAQNNLLMTARGKLLNLGMEKEMVDLIEETAKRSGAAIHQVLTDFDE